MDDENLIIRSWDMEGVTRGFWADRGTESWRIYSETDRDGRYAMPELTIGYRAGIGDEGSAISGIVILRTDGKALSARDLRRVRFPPRSRLWNEHLRARGIGTHTAPARPGPKGHPIEHWREVYALWQQAREEAPRAPVKWMQHQYRPIKADATIRRWIERAEQLHEEGKL